MIRSHQRPIALVASYRHASVRGLAFDSERPHFHFWNFYDALSTITPRLLMSQPSQVLPVRCGAWQSDATLGITTSKKTQKLKKLQNCLTIFKTICIFKNNRNSKNIPVCWNVHKFKKMFVIKNTLLKMVLNVQNKFPFLKIVHKFKKCLFLRLKNFLFSKKMFVNFKKSFYFKFCLSFSRN